MNFARNDTSVIARWWWTVDHWTLAAITILIGVGLLLTLAASPAVAGRIGLDSYYFVRHQLMYLAPAIIIILSVSLLSPKDARRAAIIALAGALLLMLLVPFVGSEIKGARRWVSLGPLSLQPSEIAKPALAVVTAWLLSTWRMEERFPGHLLALGVTAVTVGLLMMQPDLGMTVVIVVFTFAQFFVAGIPLMLVGIIAGLGALGLTGAYFALPHVASRIDRFLDPASGDTYQINTGLEAFMNGGLFGRGPGEGTVKEFLPDAHSDFVFAVAGEEMGFVLCALLVAIFAFVVLRGFGRMMSERNLFVIYAVTGLLTQFGLQAVIHMSSDMALIPTKGMTLPLISYGGSSLLGIAFGLGLVLALTRRRPGYGEA
ncbi:MAG: FtsW/RodA/SpoVE family cell cycle protein [Gemmatimonas sp.]